MENKLEEDYLIIKLIEKAEFTNLPDLELISQRESYKTVILLGKKVVPYLLERNLIIWDRALSEITGEGLNPMEYDTSERQEYWKNYKFDNTKKKNVKDMLLDIHNNFILKKL